MSYPLEGKLHEEILSSFLLYQLLARVFWCSVIRCIYIYHCYIFLIDQPLYHYEMSFFISSEFLAIESVLSDISIITQAFLS